MGAGSVKWVLSVALCALFRSAGCNSVEQKIYVDLNNTIPCVRLLNGTHQMGCQSSISGNTGVLHVLETEADLDWVLKSGPHPPYMVLMDASYFNRYTVMMQLKNSTRVTGVAVVIPSTGPPQGFSPHNKCPNQHTGVYSDSYGPGLADCNVTVWNPLGNGLSFEDFKFPIFSLKDDNQTEAIRKCISDHNVGNNGSAPAYPLCAMQMFSHMHAVTSTATCMRRNYIQEHYSLNPESVCDPLGDFNVWAPLLPLNVTSKGHKANESVVIAATRLDGRSFFWDVATAAEGTVTGFVTLLAAAHALRSVTEQAPPSRNILFTFFQGETFDYIGSSRMVYDMEKKKFVIDLDNVHSVLEIGQVGLREGTNLWMHTDPVSRTNASVDEQVRNLVANLKDSVTGLGINLAEPTVSQPLPPSSFQRFLRARPFPGVVLADHQSSFVNKYYESIYDNAAYLNVTYPSDLSPEEQLEYITDTAKVWFHIFSHLITNDCQSLPSPMTRLVQYLLANLTGTVTALNQTTCQDPSSQRNESKELYSYLWVRGPQSANSTNRDPYCVRSTVRSTLAISPAFELREYESKVYSTWTESRWKSSIKARIFLVASKELEMLTLGVGIAVLLVSLLVTYFISSKAELLFSSTREPSGTTY
uniref:Nicastrin n=1 Tax=Denticeps clupeoides TaxID=299321 RepID=A0AAY4BVM8_9TELE